MEAMVNHFEVNHVNLKLYFDVGVSRFAFKALLESSDLPLSFIVFIPDWRHPPTPALVRMENSK